MSSVQVRHPNYEGMVVSISPTDSTFPDFDGSQNCANLPTDLFYFSTRGDDEYWVDVPHNRHKEYSGTARQTQMRLLTRVCSDCPFLVQCFTHGMVSEEFGWWGGSTAEQRKQRRQESGIKLNDNSFLLSDDKILELRKLAESILLDTDD